MEALLGINQVLLFRVLAESGSEDAAKLAFQTEHEITETVDTEETATKDGNIVTPQPKTTEISATSILAKGDPLVKKLKAAMNSRSVIEIWEVDISSKENDTGNKYAATYYQGYLTEFTKSPSTEDALEIEMTFAINGSGQEGFATMTDAQIEVVQYTFTDTTPVSAG